MGSQGRQGPLSALVATVEGLVDAELSAIHEQRGVPAPGSPADQDQQLNKNPSIALGSGPRILTIARTLTAAQNLSGASQLAISGGPAAVRTLTRAVLTSSARAWWLVSPSDAGLRRARLYSDLIHSFRERAKLATSVGLTGSADGLRDLRADCEMLGVPVRTDSAGTPTGVDVDGARWLSEIDVLRAFEEAGAAGAELNYRQVTGHAHGDPVYALLDSQESETERSAFSMSGNPGEMAWLLFIGTWAFLVACDAFRQHVGWKAPPDTERLRRRLAESSEPLWAPYLDALED